MNPRYELHIGGHKMGGTLDRLRNIISNTDKPYELYAYYASNPGEDRLNELQLEQALGMRMKGGYSYQTLSRFFHVETKWMTKAIRKLEIQYRQNSNNYK